ncbi:hypothetical protein GCM10022232_66870 [Streptomyces plumbiresistens]|uniref:Uncharacterized protein n=1 Tax=Streptomyces plumbiresistens TaxID=511811 RepID=A0ABP7SPJ2_9ACTN
MGSSANVPYAEEPTRPELGRIVGPWICDPLPPPPIHPHSRDCRARPAPAAREGIAEVNGAYDQVLALLSSAKA